MKVSKSDETAEEAGREAAVALAAPETEEDVRVGDIILIPYNRMSTPAVEA